MTFRIGDGTVVQGFDTVRCIFDVNIFTKCLLSQSTGDLYFWDIYLSPLHMVLLLFDYFNTTHPLLNPVSV